jgi:hypothetical protein
MKIDAVDATLIARQALIALRAPEDHQAQQSVYAQSSEAAIVKSSLEEITNYD